MPETSGHFLRGRTVNKTVGTPRISSRSSAATTVNSVPQRGLVLIYHPGTWTNPIPVLEKRCTQLHAQYERVQADKESPIQKRRKGGRKREENGGKGEKGGKRKKEKGKKGERGGREEGRGGRGGRGRLGEGWEKGEKGLKDRKAGRRGKKLKSWS